MFSEATEEGFLAATACALGGGRELSSCRESSVGIAFVEIRGEVPKGDTPNGEAANAGALNGWIKKELRLPGVLVLVDIAGLCDCT